MAGSICFLAFGHMEELMELLEDLGAKVNKCGLINKYINFFLQYRSRSFFDRLSLTVSNNQC